ncbi:uncharacterized protein LOC134277787 [Saccostrea cucullata]|uniref:uncharacterized protein LOC134277787 n=1 Tax=Saccostrea cuccullata TaxID=36930 RepID=UPI002ED307FF
MSSLVRKTLLCALNTRSSLQQNGFTAVRNLTSRTMLSKRTFSSPVKFPRQFGSFQQRWCHQKSASLESDSNLSKYLESEIKSEMEDGIEEVDNLLDGWSKECEGVKIVLNKKKGKETVRVKFSIAGALEEYGPEGEEVEYDMPLFCKPPFEVEIVKPSGNTMAIRCMISEGMGEEPSEDDVSDRFEIINVAMTQGEVKETTYVCEAENMDVDMYEGLMDVLDERGIDRAFTQDLIEFSTKYEKKAYVGFISSMKKFADE